MQAVADAKAELSAAEAAAVCAAEVRGGGSCRRGTRCGGGAAAGSGGTVPSRGRMGAGVQERVSASRTHACVRMLFVRLLVSIVVARVMLGARGIWLLLLG